MRRFDVRDAILTDSGTSALIIALLVLAPNRPVAMPAYACVDLVAAARAAGIRIVLYDVDPETLSPDLASLRRVVEAGVSGIVVAHLYGYPADVPSVASLASEFGVPVIEDAAQQAGGVLGGKVLGSFGDIVVLSFGRGKGTTSGRGGAILARQDDIAESIKAVTYESRHGRGYGDIFVATASWCLGRPRLYAIPASLPWLHLGETVYHAAHAPRRMSQGASALLDRTFGEIDDSAATRRRNALVLEAAVVQSRHVRRITPIEAAAPGYLRFPIVFRGEANDAPVHGITHGYPRPLSSEPEIQPILHDSGEPLHGAAELASRLVTLPTHSMITTDDLKYLTTWLHEA